MKRYRLKEETRFLIDEEKTPRAVSEFYRTLRTNLTFSQADHPIRSLLITSSVPEEGKSMTVANLGITFALAQNKVLLIDSDLRRPILHHLFGLNNTKGLTHMLVGTVEPDEIYQATRVNNLWVATCGLIPPNPSELLSSQKMQDFLKLVQKRFDMVLLDSPPVTSLADAAILSSLVGNVLLVVLANKTSRDMILRARYQLETVNARIVGVVLNSVDLKKERYYYNYYYYYSSYYSYGDK
ncbi:MAG TPA: CpsD/CapB family tyrosine-protein kinase [Candidatus Limnocylindrales bacterium]|nr:CpsD/CapB family tyrosine-protein kinase [Candidatus Limnocylindrales bacterium]